jgi:predicted transcriptional regulator
MTAKDEHEAERLGYGEGALAALRDLDIDVLRTLGDDEGRVAFQGLRRRMNVHQERLSRSLQRLEDEGLVSKGPRGYVLTDKGSAFAHRWFSPASSNTTKILESFLPTDLSPHQVAGRLEGKWFASLRWLGAKDEPDGATLRWITDETGVEVILRVTWGKIMVETNATNRDGLWEAFLAAQRIFGQLSGSWAQDWKHPQLSVST